MAASAVHMAFLIEEPSRPYPHTVEPSTTSKSRPDAFCALQASFDVSSGRPEGAALDNRGARFPGGVNTEKPKLQNASRWKLKAQVVGLLRPSDGGRGPAVCGCGRPGHEVEEVTLHRRESGAAGVGGVYRCDSPWLCPTCAPARAQRRKERISQVINATEALGGDCALITLTVRHKKGDALASLKRAVSDAARKARQGRAWLRIQSKAQIFGVIVGCEVTYSLRNGWHYHLHILVPCGITNTLSESDDRIFVSKRHKEISKPVMSAMRSFVARYIINIRKAGYNARYAAQRVDIVWSGDAGDYLTKGSACWEVSGGLKEARGAVSRTPWQLAQLADAGDDDARRLFEEYASVMPGTRSCVVSASLAEALDLSVDDDDDDKSGEDQDLSSTGEVLGTVSVATWGRIITRGKAHEVMASIEDGDTWVKINDLVQRLGQPPPTPPPPKRLIDVDRFAVDAARWRSVGRSPASCINKMRADIDNQKRSYERAGYVVHVDHDRADRAFLKAALEMR